MNSEAFVPFGNALLAFHQGDLDTRFSIHREDGLNNEFFARDFFRPEENFSEIERQALSQAHGHILDIGAGAGPHSLYLQANGARVTALDINPAAVAILKDRGIRNVLQADVMTLNEGTYDTLLLLGHGIGMVESIQGLDQFLIQARKITPPGGQILVHSRDVRITDNPAHLAYHVQKIRKGEYPGKIKMRFEFRELTGPYCNWLHIDPALLAKHAQSAGWADEQIYAGAEGTYLARLSRQEHTVDQPDR